MHHWQDLVLAICILGFNVALLPTLFSKKHNPHVGTGVMTACFQLVAFFVYVNLRLWYSAIMGLINAILWCLLVAQGLASPKSKVRKNSR